MMFDRFIDVELTALIQRFDSNHVRRVLIVVETKKRKTNETSKNRETFVKNKSSFKSERFN